ncbi:class I adenylate-forming enzyme family protein [Variovorax sp. Sphag1AA]|uniref:class I adenylate-forming enzyme family protein n=1 Tax=Variovorax sp. Sphag1AA TaxID=2587027 RepID=UPI001616D4AB|nr:AMP-binding protein [Variovorax sp. Sphag1AA]MBB3179266.1 feruloyl-CoA synthase [Variovorax sp. Sphag1AA]
MTDFVSVIDQHARVQADKECLCAAGRSYSYAEFAELSRRAATALRAQGIGAGDKVALLCFNTAGFVIAMFGAWRLGAVVVPINHKLQAPEIDYILAHSGSKLCVVDGALAAVAQRVGHSVTWVATDSAAEGMPLLEALLERAEPLADEPAPASDALAQILYTSGTTGKPKGCLHTHGNVFFAAICAAAGTGLTRNERTLIAMPVWHSSPLNNWLLGTLLMGGSAVLLREYAPKPFLDALAGERISFTFGAPIAFLAPLAVVPDVKSYDFSAMRMWAYGGGPLGADMARKLADSYGSDRFVQVYGMTESGPLGTVLYPEEAIAKAGSIGRSGVPGVAIEVRGADGKRCTAGEVGEIHLRSPAIMKGYLDNPEATAAAFDAHGWYRTGDLARIDEDGFLFIVDRLRDMIITGGENVYSKEVEDVLSTHPDVQDVAVIGRPHPEWGETVTAVLVAKPGRTLDADALREFLIPKLARYKIPRGYEFVEALPRTATGKLLKHLLKA